MSQAFKDAVCEVIVTAPNVEQLRTITRTLVKERLVACGHHFETINSIYRWNGEVHDESEARVGLHTRSTLVTAITLRIKQMHPYDVPCVVAVPITGGNPDYHEWIVEQTDRSPQ